MLPPRPLLATAVAALAGLVLLPSIALAHPLGNFTINHYAGLRVEPDAIRLDVVIDQAEIPTFQARVDRDLDGDGTVSEAEIETARIAGCAALAPSLDLRVDGVRQSLRGTEAGLTFPEGAGGLTTMRQVCGYEVLLPAGIVAGSTVAFADVSYAERIGWREIVVEASGVTIEATDDSTVRTSSASRRLTAYPDDQLAQPLADDAIAVRVTGIGGATLPAFAIADAGPLDAGAGPGSGGPASPGSAGVPPDATGEAPDGAGVIPGGVDAGELPSIFRVADLTPLVLLLSLGTAVLLGAGHALTPGHGKTLMAAYLVGTRGTPVHAVGLGLSVTLSHTLGILALAALIVGAQGILAPDVVVRTAPIIAAVSIVAIGGWMLLAEVRRRRGLGRSADGHQHGHAHDGNDAAHANEHDAAGDTRAHEAAHEHASHDRPGHPHPHPHAHAHAHPHPHPHPHPSEPPRSVDARPAGEHSHGGVRHSHLPATGSVITWRSLFVLGLAGGLIPSTSALLILLGSIAAGRPIFGFVLVVAFGLGMAVVMASIGIALVVARGRLDRFDTGSALGRLGQAVPLIAAITVLTFGCYLTVQAIAGTPIL
jgi:ABC-type nickel/cobalt efflux system permease component RcnA